MSADSPNLTMGVFPDEDPLLASVKRAAHGKYDILGELGRGGMACVYLAHDLTLDRRVAIKVMLPEVVRLKGMTERFKQEAKTAGKLGHPHIVPIYAVHDTENSVFFVMKYVDGRPLDKVIKELGPLPFDMARTVMNQIASGLDFAHRHGVIHRDVKPANVMLDNEGFAVVTDFGVAKITQDAGLTHSGSVVGTPYYMSPEQGVGEKVTPASDQYSLGVVAYELLTGVRPFEDQSYGALVVAHQSRPVPPIVGLRPDCPPHMRAAVERMMAKSPEHRFPTLRDAVDAFCATARDNRESVRATMITLAKNVRPIARVSTPVSPSFAPPAQQPQAPPPPAPPSPATPVGRASRKWFVGGGIVALVLLGALAGTKLIDRSFPWPGHWRGVVAATMPVEFGGGAGVCRYGVSFENTSMRLVLETASVQQGTIAGRTIEITVGDCPWRAQAPSDHQYTLSSGRVTGDSIIAAFNGAESNRPRTAATFRGVGVKRSGLVEGEVEIRRTDITGTLAWTVTMPMTLQQTAEATPLPAPTASEFGNKPITIQINAVQFADHGAGSSANLALSSTLGGVAIVIDGQQSGVVGTPANPSRFGVTPNRPIAISYRLIGCRSWDTVITMPPAGFVDIERKPACP